MNFRVNAGPHVSILNETAFGKFDNMRKMKLRPPTRTLLPFVQGSRPVIGCFTVQLEFRNRVAPIEFFVIKRSLLGMDAVHYLKLVLSGGDIDSYYLDAVASRRDISRKTSTTLVA